MSLSEHTSCFATSPVWLGAIAAAEQIDGDFVVWLRAQKLASPFFWAGFLGGRNDDDDRKKAAKLLTGDGAMGLDEASEKRRIDMIVELCRVARELGGHWISQVAGLSDPLFTLDRAQTKRKVEEDAEHQRLVRIRAISALTLPTEWRGKAYRRLEAAGDEKGRERAEEKERLRGAKRVLKVLEEALGKTAWLCGSQPSIADIDVYGVVAYAPQAGFDLAAYPAISAWTKRMEALPGFIGINDLPKATQA